MALRAALINPDQIDAKESFDKCLAYAMGLPPPHVRLVDRLQPRERQRPMKLLCLGFSRTGTYSLYLALTSLGYKPYHMAETMTNPAVEFPVWIDALRAKHDGRDWDKQQWSGEDFDKVLAGYDVWLSLGSCYSRSTANVLVSVSWIFPASYFRTSFSRHIPTQE